MNCHSEIVRMPADFGRPIGQNQGIQHPLAKSWMELEGAHLMVHKRAWLHDQHLPCGADANGATYPAWESAIFTHGGMGYAKEYRVERYLRESWIPRLAPVSPQLILCFIAEKVLGLPKSYRRSLMAVPVDGRPAGMMRA